MTWMTEHLHRQSLGVCSQGLKFIPKVLYHVEVFLSHHNPPSTTLYIWDNGVGQVPFSWQPPNPDSSTKLTDREADMSPQLYSPAAASFALRLVMQGLDAAARHENLFQEAPYALFLS